MDNIPEYDQPEDFEDLPLLDNSISELEDIPDPENIEDIEEVEDNLIAPAPVVKAKVNYLNNKDMLKEIHKSKNSFSEYTHPKYSDYDAIVEHVDRIFDPEVQEAAKTEHANRLTQRAYEIALASYTGKDKPKVADFRVKSDTINANDLVFRVLTYEHIPAAPGRKKTPKTVADHHVKLNFAPFKHYIIDNGKAVEVGRSHTKKGKFSLDHGSITNKLANMFILMVNKYAQRSNWRNYTYLDEMKGQALLQLSLMSLQFDEGRSDNPFAYYTQSLQNSFTRVVNLEKRNQDLRDDLLINNGASPSFSRQLAIEDEIRRLREDAQNSTKDY